MLGQRLTELRKSKNLTQEEIAKKLHLTRSTYAQYEVKWMAAKRYWLVEARGKQELSQQDVADRANISRSTYAQFEVGRRNPTVSNAQKIALVLGIDWTLFFTQVSRVKRQNKTA